MNFQYTRGMNLGMHVDSLRSGSVRFFVHDRQGNSIVWKLNAESTKQFLANAKASLDASRQLFADEETVGQRIEVKMCLREGVMQLTINWVVKDNPGEIELRIPLAKWQELVDELERFFAKPIDPPIVWEDSFLN